MTTARSPAAFVPRQFLAGLARYDLGLFLTGLWNATDDGSIFLHCFTCSKWNHMLSSTAFLLSVIGSTCTRQTSSKAEPPQLASLLPWVWGATFWGRLSGRSRCAHWEHLSTGLTWIYMSEPGQWDDCIACPAGHSGLLQSKLRVCKRTRPWHRPACNENTSGSVLTA